MRCNKIFLLGFGIPTLCAATVPDLNSGYCARLDRIAAAASQSQTSVLALGMLQSVAMGRTTDILPEAEELMGLSAGELRRPAFRQPGVRACAFWKIGETGLAAALAFLSSVQRADIGADAYQVWPAAQIALKNAQLKQIGDPQSKIEFLEGALMELRYGGGALGYWIIDQLCDGGASASLVAVRRSIRSRMNGSRDEDDIRFCEARMSIVARYSDRVRAIGSVLRVENEAEEERLIRWAIYQLAAMHTPAADAELSRFAREIERLPVASIRRQQLNTFKREIDGMPQMWTK